MSTLRISEEEILETAIAVTSARGLYFLIRKNEIVYVGQSENVHARVMKHYAEGTKKFDSYSYILITSGNLDYIEGEYILEIEPQYNTTLPTYDGVASLAMLKSILGANKYQIKKYIKEQGLVSRMGFYDLSDFEEFEG